MYNRKKTNSCILYCIAFAVVFVLILTENSRVFGKRYLQRRRYPQRSRNVHHAKLYRKSRRPFDDGHRKGRRVQYHIQGIRGPKSYTFGFETGDECNPLTRHESRSRDGVVKGHYSYVDPKGVTRVVHYEAHPKHGFRVLLNAHTMDANKSKKSKTSNKLKNSSKKRNRNTKKRHRFPK